MIGYWHDAGVCPSVCLSLTKCIVAERYILTAKVSEQVSTPSQTDRQTDRQMPIAQHTACTECILLQSIIILTIRINWHWNIFIYYQCSLQVPGVTWLSMWAIPGRWLAAGEQCNYIVYTLYCVMHITYSSNHACLLARHTGLRLATVTQTFVDIIHNCQQNIIVNISKNR